MKTIKLLNNKSISDYIISDSKFTPIDKSNTEFNIKNITNDEYYELEDNKFIFHDLFKDIYWLIDRNKQYSSGCFKDREYGGICESCGCEHDMNWKSVNYRIPRNGSTAITRSYISDYRKDFDRDYSPWVCPSNKLKNYFITFSDFKNSDYYKSSIKYFVWRDPIERFLSQCVLYLTGGIKYFKGDRLICDTFYKDKNSVVNHLYQCMKINEYYKWMDEYHLVNQTDRISQIVDSFDDIDYIVHINDLENFFVNKLNIRYKKLIRYNNDNRLFISDIPNNVLTDLNKIFECDYKIYDDCEDKLYTRTK